MVEMVSGSVHQQDCELWKVFEQITDCLLFEKIEDLAVLKVDQKWWIFSLTLYFSQQNKRPNQSSVAGINIKLKELPIVIRCHWTKVWNIKKIITILNADLKLDYRSSLDEFETILSIN